jgi:hypothetical protein
MSQLLRTGELLPTTSPSSSSPILLHHHRDPNIKSELLNTESDYLRFGDYHRVFPRRR